MFSYGSASAVPSIPRQPLPLRSLSQVVGGGFPLGHWIEVTGARSSGKATVALSACLGVLRQGRAAAWIDGRGDFSPLPALEAGEDLSRLWVVKVSDVKNALRACGLLLSSPGAVGALVVDLPQAGTVPDSQWVRLQRLAQRSGTVIIALGETGRRPISLSALRLSVRRVYPMDSVQKAGREPTLSQTLQIEVARHKGGPNDRSILEHLDGPDRLRVPSSL